jgi:hypothetical protein
MTFDMTFVLIAVCSLTFAGFCMSVYLNIKMGITILKIEDSIVECLDILDERYTSISKILDTPVFFDSVEIRQVIDDIRSSRRAVLVVANSLTNIQESEEDDIKAKA